MALFQEKMNMKTLIIIIALAMARILYADPVTVVADEGTLMGKVNQLVEALVIKYPYPRDNPVMVEMVRTSAEFVQLKNLCMVNWRSILDNLDAVTSEDAGKSMLIVAFEEGLDASDYTTVLERLSDNFQKKQISVSLMKTALTPLGRMQLFLVYNYRNARVQALLKNLKPYVGDDAYVQRQVTEILSGKRKRENDIYNKDHKLSVQPVLLGPPISYWHDPLIDECARLRMDVVDIWYMYPLPMLGIVIIIFGLPIGAVLARRHFKNK